MRTLSLIAFTSLLILWGAYFFLRNNTNQRLKPDGFQVKVHSDNKNEENNTLLDSNKIKELDKIGAVINENNADLDQQTINQIRVAKKIYDAHQSLEEKEVLLEQSYLDHASGIKDIQNLQDGITTIKNKLKINITNTEKWDPRFVYYLMIQENYTYQEVNQIKSLSENGINAEELNYINELIKQDSFTDRILTFKSQSESGRTIASQKKMPDEKDEFLEGESKDSLAENKLIEMNYNNENRQ